MEKVAMIKPTSKSELKQSCLMLANLDVDKAERMYDFLVKDMREIPDVPPAQKSFMTNFGEQATGVLGWFRENEDVFVKGFEFDEVLVADADENNYASDSERRILYVTITRALHSVKFYHVAPLSPLLNE